MRRAASLALWIAGSKRAASTETIEITTMTSTSVKPENGRRVRFSEKLMNGNDHRARWIRLGRQETRRRAVSRGHVPKRFETVKNNGILGFNQEAKSSLPRSRRRGYGRDSYGPVGRGTRIVPILGPLPAGFPTCRSIAQPDVLARRSRWAEHIQWLATWPSSTTSKPVFDVA